MRRSQRLLFVEAATSVAAAVLAAVTLAWHDWIEVVFRVDPDHGNGSAETLVVAALAAVALVAGAMARRTWRRRRMAPGQA